MKGIDSCEKDFKLADYVKPPLEEGKYSAEGTQKVSLNAAVKDTFSITKDFYVTANTETISPDEIFSVYPLPEQQGDFSGTLPFMVLNNKNYPWMRHWTADIDALPIPYLALIVISEDEEAQESDIQYSALAGLKESGVFFPYNEKSVSTCKAEDTIHILSIPKKTYTEIMPAKEDLPWLTHAKFVNLSASEDSISEKDGWFSTIIANRFIPSKKNASVKSTVHLISVDAYLNNPIPANCERVRFISMYHWNVYSEKTEEKSFVSLINGLERNSASVKEKSLKPHFLRSGEKTYSFYRSPLLPLHSARYENINGEEKFTADGRLIYDAENGIFDVSYSAAFNIGRFITLSRRAEAEKIVAWRKNESVEHHLKKLDSSIGDSQFDVKELCTFLTEKKLVCKDD
jgi:hypothetical protein